MPPALERLEARLLLSASPVITEFPLTSSGAGPAEIVSGPDGNLWFTEANGNNIGRITPGAPNTITEFSLPTSGSAPGGITAGPDGNLWFTEVNGNNIGRITTSGVVTEFSVTTQESSPDFITEGPNGNLWFTESAANQIGEITTAGVVTEFSIPTADSEPEGIVTGPNGNLWFTEGDGNKIGEITTAGVVTEFTLPTADSEPADIAVGPDGNLWFTEVGTNQIGRITTAGVVTEFTIPTADSDPLAITSGPNGDLFFTEFEGDNIGEITTAGAITEFAIPTADSAPLGITTGPDGNIWFTEGFTGKIGRLQLAEAPVIDVPAPVSLNENTSLTFANADAISVTDNSGTAEELTLTVGHGNLTLGTTTGLTVTGNDSPSLTASGPLASLNSDLGTLSYTPGANFTGDDNLSLSDKDTSDGLTGTNGVDITVNEVAGPSATFSNNGPIIEGSTAVVRFSNPHDSLVSGNPGFRYSYSFGDNGTFEIKDSSNPSATVPLSFLLTPGPHLVEGRITDKRGNFTDYTTTILVNPSVPTVTLKTPLTTVVPGQPMPFVIELSDNAPSASCAAFTITISFGDGTTQTFTRQQSLVVTHIYKTDNTFNVRVTATDKFGNSSTPATQSIDVSPVTLETDPFCPSATALFVGVTAGNNTVTFAPSGRGSISVTLNGASEGVFKTNGPLVVFGQGGHVVIHKSPHLRNPSFLIENAHAAWDDSWLVADALRWAGFAAACEVLNA